MTTAYTPLESLLLFQALHIDGVTQSSFNKISDQLKSIPLIRNAPEYDGGRLSPDALRELYLGLLKEEVKHDLEHQSQHNTNGDHPSINGDVSSPGSRKRKAASPSLPTVREAAQHAHLIPQLVTRLYTRYRDQALANLKSRSIRYATLKQDARQIEAGEWDETLRRTRAVSETQSPRPSSTAHTRPLIAQPSNVQPVSSASASPVVPAKHMENSAQVQQPRYTQAKIDAMINHGPEPQNGSSTHRRTSSNTTLPPLSEMAPQSPHFPIASKGITPSPIQPMPHAPNHPYTQSPPAGNQSPYAAQHAHPRTGSMASPQVQQTLSRPSSSPRPVLPPPNGMQFAPPATLPHPASPGMHGTPLLPQHPPPPPPSQYQQQGRGPTGTPYKPEATSRYPVTPAGHQHQAVGYYPQQQQQQQHYVDRRTSYPPPQGPQTPVYPPQGGYMLPPFQIQSQDPNRPIHQPPQSRAQHSPAIAQRPHFGHAPIAPATAPRPAFPQHSQMSMVVNALATPLRNRSRNKSLWKNASSLSGSQTPRPRPAIEPLSPGLERAKLPERVSALNRSQEVPTIEAPPSMEAPVKGRGRRRKTIARDRSPHSVVSSTAEDSLRARTRSHSVSTTVGRDHTLDDRPASRNGVKPEPSTPAYTMDDADPTPSGMMTRKRRGTVQSSQAPPSKRKRNESPEAAGDTHETEPPLRSNTIIATKNFAKMSQALMNDITSHKHGSYFQKEVRDKDAPGYSEIVKQPQTLKSIGRAIAAGTRAVTAASSTLESPSATSATSTTTIELERSVDLIPPKAIVNGAQLEKELMRMFANAYMFNPGEDGMALTTKEMFEDVEQKIKDWRGTEREAGGDEDDQGKRRGKV